MLFISQQGKTYFSTLSLFLTIFTVYDSGVLPTPHHITDHFATYIVLPHNYSVSSVYTRRVWFYMRADFVKLDNNLRSFDWKSLSEGSVNDSCTLFTNNFMDFINECIPHKDVTIRPNGTIRIVKNQKLLSQVCGPIGLNTNYFVIKLLSRTA